MQDIDFLPQSYREQHAQRQLTVSRAGVVAVALLLLGLGIAHQYSSYHRAHGLLAAAKARKLQVQSLVMQRDGLQKRLDAAESVAQLYVYLESRWSRAHMLHVLVGALPESVYLQRVELRRGTAPATARTRPARGDEATPDTANVDTATATLVQLRQAFDAAPAVVHITGRAEQMGDVHGYLNRLGGSDLFESVELLDFETDLSNDRAAARFSLEITLRPPYASPGGPTPQAPSPADKQPTDGPTVASIGRDRR